MHIRAPTNTNLLKVKMMQQGHEAYVSYLSKILSISRTTASKKLYGNAQFTQSEIFILRNALLLSSEEVCQIFLNSGGN